LGEEQLSWIKKKVNSGNFNWTILGQQVLMTKLKFPDLTTMIKEEDIPEFLKPYLKFLGLGIPSNLDAWDGYPADRNKLYDVMKKSNKNFISLAGDTHNAWVSELTDSLGSKIGVELGTPSVSSPGITDAIKIDKTKFATEITKNNSELNWMDPEHRGYLTLDFNEDELEARFNFIAELKKLDSTIFSTKTFQVLKDNLEISTKRV
jgi:alkaline phosphatase D